MAYKGVKSPFGIKHVLSEQKNFTLQELQKFKKFEKKIKVRLLLFCCCFLLLGRYCLRTGRQIAPLHLHVYMRHLIGILAHQCYSFISQLDFVLLLCTNWIATVTKFFGLLPPCIYTQLEPKLEIKNVEGRMGWRR